MADGVVTLPEVTDVGTAPAAAPAEPQGVHAFAPQPGMVAVTNPDGSVGMVRQEDAPTAFAQGLRPSTRAEVVEQQMGTGGQVVAGLVGASRGVTGGLSDVGLVEGSRLLGGDKEAEDTRRVLNDARDTYPNTSLGSEVAGSLAGMYLLPGGGAAAEGALGEGLLARGLSRFAAAAPRAGLEGAAFALGHQASEDELGNHAATAEKYLASAAQGFVFGGLLGGGLHAVGGAVADKARGFYGSLSRGADALAEGGAGQAATKAAGAAEGEGGSPFLNWLRDKVTTGAEEQAFKSTGAKIRDFQKLGSTVEAQNARVSRIGRRLLDEGIVDATASQETIAQRLAEKVQETGAELGALRKGLDKATVRPSTSAIVDRVQSEVLAPLERIPGTQTEVHEVQKYMVDFIDKAGDHPSFETLHEFRRALGDKLDPKLWQKIPGSAPAGAVELGKVHRIIEQEFETAGEKAAQELGNTFGDKYRVLKSAYSDLKTASDIVRKEVARGGANRTWSLTDTIAAGAGFAGAGPAGVAAAVANKALRTYGNQAAADILNRASKLQFLTRAAEQVDGQITSGVRGFLSGTKIANAAPPAPKVNAATVAAIREATRDPVALTEKIRGMLGGQGLADAAPNVAQQAAITAARIAAYIRDKAPKDPAPTGPSFVPQRPRAGSATEQARFADAVEAANNPISVVDDLRRGRVSREKVEALKACYPELYGQIRSEIASQAVNLRPNLTQQQEIAISVLFDMPLSAIMQPKNIRAFNDSFAQGADPSQSTAQAGGQQPMAGNGVHGLNRKGTLASGFDKQEEAP